MAMIDRAIARTTPSFVEASEHRYPFQQRRLARAVLADKNRYGIIEDEFKFAMLEKWEAKGVNLAIGNVAAVQPDALEVRWRQCGVSMVASHAFPYAMVVDECAPLAVQLKAHSLLKLRIALSRNMARPATSETSTRATR